MHTVQNRVLTQEAIWLQTGALFYQKKVSQEPVLSSAQLSVQNGTAREEITFAWPPFNQASETKFHRDTLWAFVPPAE